LVVSTFQTTVGAVVLLLFCASTTCIATNVQEVQELRGISGGMGSQFGQSQRIEFLYIPAKDLVAKLWIKNQGRKAARDLLAHKFHDSKIVT